MSHLPRQEILRLIGTDRLIEENPPLNSPEFELCLQPDSYDFRIGVVVAAGAPRVDRAHPRWDLPPGEMAIIVTEEIVNMPAALGAEVTPRALILSDGLLVLAAPHIDPGYQGPLTARIVNLRDKPYPLEFATPMLTTRFYRLAAPVDNLVPVVVSKREKLERARRESRDTFNRLFMRPEEIVLKSELTTTAVTQALTWLALLVPAIVAFVPFSIPVFWNHGVRMLGKALWIQVAIMAGAVIVVFPLLIMYYWFMFRLVTRRRKEA